MTVSQYYTAPVYQQLPKIHIVPMFLSAHAKEKNIPFFFKSFQFYKPLCGFRPQQRAALESARRLPAAVSLSCRFLSPHQTHHQHHHTSQHQLPKLPVPQAEIKKCANVEGLHRIRGLARERTVEQMQRKRQLKCGHLHPAEWTQPKSMVTGVANSIKTPTAS